MLPFIMAFLTTWVLFIICLLLSPIVLIHSPFRTWCGLCSLRLVTKRRHFYTLPSLAREPTSYTAETVRFDLKDIALWHLKLFTLCVFNSFLQLGSHPREVSTAVHYKFITFLEKNEIKLIPLFCTVTFYLQLDLVAANAKSSLLHMRTLESYRALHISCGLTASFNVSRFFMYEYSFQS